MFTITFPVHDTPGNFIFIAVSSRSLSQGPTLTGQFIVIPVATASNQKSIVPISRTAISTSLPSFMLLLQSEQLFSYAAVTL